MVIQRSKLSVLGSSPPPQGIWGFLVFMVFSLVVFFFFLGFLVFLVFCFGLVFWFLKHNAVKNNVQVSVLLVIGLKLILCIQMLAQIRVTILVTVVVNVTHFV